MTGRLRRAGPWATPTLVVAEIVLIGSGLLRVRTAIAVGLIFEVVLWLTAASRLIAAARRFRAGRSAGLDGWQAAEDGLAQLVPHRLARILLIEPRLWVCAAQWIAGRRRDAGEAFGYDAALRPLLWSVIGLLVVEGATVDVVLALALPGSSWIWVSLGIHLYAVAGLLGVLASFSIRPHILERDALRIRDGIFTELIIPYEAITAARVHRTPNLGRSGLKVDPAQQTAMLAHGDGTVVLTLDPDRPIAVAASRVGARTLATLTLTVNAPERFVRALTIYRDRSLSGSNT